MIIDGWRFCFCSIRRRAGKKSRYCTYHAYFHSLQRWVSTKYSISQLECTLIFIIFLYCQFSLCCRTQRGCMIGCSRGWLLAIRCRNALHGLPPNMDRTLPYLKKLELYGNSIDEIKMPEVKSVCLCPIWFCSCIVRESSRVVTYQQHVQ